MQPEPDATRTPTRLIAVFVGLTLLLMATGKWVFLDLADTLKEREHERLQAISSLKAAQIASWVDERIADARVVTSGPYLSDAIGRMLAGASGDERRIRERLESIRATYRYAAVELFDMEGRNLLSAGQQRHDDLGGHDGLVQTLADRSEPLLLDFMREAHPGQPLAFALALAVRDATAPGRTPLAIAVFVIDPEVFLFPLIRSWPDASPSAESVLVRQDGSDIVVISPVRHLAAAPLSLRFPMTDKERIGVRAVASGAGLVEGNDYRGVPVLAAVHSIANTPWRVVSKIDRAEVLGDLRVLAWTVGGVVLLAVVLAGTILLLFWRRQLHDDIERRARIGELLQTTIDSVEEGILLIGPGGSVLRWNRRFQELWSVPDMLLAAGEDERLLAFVLDQLAEPQAFVAEVNRLYGTDEVTFETIAFRDGRVFERYTCPVATENGRARLWSFRDVTEQRRAESELRLFGEAMEQATEAIVMAEPDYTFRYVNPAFERLFGYSLAEIKGRPISLLVPEDETLAVANAVAHGPFEGERLRRAKDGRLIPVLLKVAPIADAEKGIAGFVGTLTDLTALKAIEADLRESEAKHRTLFEMANDGIFLQDATRFVDCNARGAAMYGLAREEILGRSPADFCPERQPDGRLSAEVAAEKIDAALAGAPQVFEWRPLRADGTPFDVEITMNRVEMGGAVYLQAIVRDITERKRTQDALRASEEKLRGLYELSPLGIALTDMQGRYLEFNEAFRATCGYPESELKALDERTLTPDRYADEEARQFELLERSGRHGPYEKEYRRKDGSLVPIRVNGMLVTGAGGKPHIWSIVEDISASQQAAAALKESEARYRRFIDEAPLGIVITQNGVIRLVNRALMAMVGATVEEIEGQSFLQFVQGADRERVTDMHRRRMRGEAVPESYECRFVIRSGEERCWRLAVRTIEWDGTAALAVISDVTELRRAEEKLRLAASVFDSAHDGIVITDAAANVVDVNAAFCRITGYGREEILGKNPRVLKSGHQDRAFYETMWHALSESGHWSGEVWNRRKDGQVYAELLTVSAVPDERGEVGHYVGVLADITPLKEHERELERIAHFDALTGIPNRVLLADRMGQAVAQTLRAGNMMAVCYLDLDGFKPINDEFGHEAGDRLLVEMARRMKECVRGGDTVARIGGDEFVLLLLNVETTNECEAILDRVLDAVAQPVSIDSYALAVTASVGVTLFPPDHADPDTLLRHADQAMYLAKQGGKYVYRFFDADQDTQARAYRDMINRVEEGLAREEFVLHYQPKVNMRSGAVVGFEALIRWQHPEKGLLTPTEFLPFVEGTDLIVEIGEYVIDRALAQLCDWQRNGLETSVSINIAPRHLLRENFVEHLRRRMEAHCELPANRLEIEVLETAALEDNHHVAGIIHACRQIGVSFALDDFGTGYSSLTYLKTLPTQTLKIDQSFVQDMLTNANDLAIVEGVIGLTEIFRRKVIAEGVETIEHGTLLLNLGCELAQGFGIAHPMPAAAVADWIRHWKPDVAWSATSEFRWPRDDYPLLIAENNHRVWIEEISAFVEGLQAAPPVLDSRACRFGRWYAGDGQRRYGRLPQFAAIGGIHEKVHALGNELKQLVDQGRQGEARARLAELLALREELVGALRRLLAVTLVGR
jgi:diguanylate cyclase (GGDEF)-like protein/PAS domain S-box-containing protein